MPTDELARQRAKRAGDFQAFLATLSLDQIFQMGFAAGALEGRRKAVFKRNVVSLRDYRNRRGRRRRQSEAGSVP